jgi:hypothetical protein
MMKDLRAHHDIDAFVAKRQFQRVAAHNRVIAPPIAFDENGRQVKSNRSERDAAFRSEKSGGFGYVGRSSPHVEQVAHFPSSPIAGSSSFSAARVPPKSLLACSTSAIARSITSGETAGLSRISIPDDAEELSEDSF